jgi:hypothetical protein
MYSFSSDCAPLKDEISQYFRAAFRDKPQFDVTHVKDATNIEEACDLLIHFEMVDDRIRQVGTKADYAKNLLQQTQNNCVWVFFCFKPTNNEEGTKIANSLKGFPSGYTTADGEFISTHLTFEYIVNSTQKDKQGNFKHFLAEPYRFAQNISQFVQQTKA